VRYESQINQKIKFAKYHINDGKEMHTIVENGKSQMDDIRQFANIHAFFWECRSILELVAQEIYANRYGVPKEEWKINFFEVYKNNFKGEGLLDNTDKIMSIWYKFSKYRGEEKLEEKEGELNRIYDVNKDAYLFIYLNEYRNAISHREEIGRSFAVDSDNPEPYSRPRKYDFKNGTFLDTWENMTWEQLLNDILKMTLKIKDEIYGHLFDNYEEKKKQIESAEKKQRQRIRNHIEKSGKGIKKRE